MRRLVVLTLLAALAALAAAAPAHGAGLDLERCGAKGLRAAGFRCATVTVPKDYANPAAGTLQVAVTVRKAKGPRRLGPLFVNFGGPGGPAVAGLEGFRSLLPRAVRRRFDLVGMDPRGVGASRPAIDCHVDQRKLGLYSFPTARPGADLTAYQARVQAYVDRCAQRNAAVAPYVGTANVARDMDVVRDALGAGKLTYLGFSYGTVLGATYLKLFPDHTRAAVLDGVVDVDAWYNRPHGDLLGQTAGLEDALDRFLAATERAPRRAVERRWTGGKDPRAAFDALVAKATATPLRLRSGRRVTGDEVLNAVAGDLYSKLAWPSLAAMLNGVRKGHGGTAAEQSDSQLGGVRGPLLDRYFVISAADQPYADDVPTTLAWGEQAAAQFPHFAFNVGYTELHYARWPVDGVGVDRGPFALAPTAPTPLVVGTTHDPATPYAGAQATAAAFGRARLLTMEGDGHTAYLNGSRCIDTAIATHLLTGRLPAEGTRCRQRIPYPAPSGKARASATPHYFTPRRSTTKTSVSSGAIAPPAPRLP